MQTAATSLKAKLVSQAVRDPLFRAALDDAADEIIKVSNSAANEATIEAAFERILYATLKAIGLPFHPEKEKPIATRRHTAKGRTDSRLGALIIEYKQPSTLSSAKQVSIATQQLSDYVIALAEQSNNEVVGYLTDGVQIMELRADADGVLSESAFQSVDGQALDRLVRSIISLDKSALSSANLIRDFCKSDGDGTIFEVARKLNHILSYKSTLKTEMLRTEWEALFRLAHEDQSQQRRIQDRRIALGDIFRVPIEEPTMEYQALFALHTAYAIVLKMIAYRVVADVKFGQTLFDYKSLTTANADVMRAFVASLEDGELFRQIGILNLLEGDFFSWYADEKQWDNVVSDGIREILITLSRYEDTRAIFQTENAVDLFRSLYEATVPQVVRSSLGEFYTPYWLADHVLESSNPTAEWNALDPCCGSGTFLIAAIARIRRECSGLSPKDLADAILSRVAGIDLNPLAVLTARVHVFIHIADLLDAYDDEIAIPVYLGDASNIPTRVEENGVEFIHYELKTLKTPLSINIPARMAEDALPFAKAMFEFERFIKSADYDEAKQFLVDHAAAYDDATIVKQRMGELADQIIDLEKREWNGIWARVIANFVATACIGPFTNVIGNPPWVDWKSLPSGYRDKVKSLCIDKGLFSGAGRTGGINLNVCALIAHVAATNWLAEGGHMALLMPRELANQASYEGWRRSVGGAHCAMIEFHDWSGAGHPFYPVKEDFMTFVFERNKRNQKIIPTISYSKNERREKAHLWETLEQASAFLDAEKGFAGQIVADRTGYTFARTKTNLNKYAKIAGFCPYIGREGIEFYPQELLIFTYVGPGPVAGTALMQNIQVQKSKYRIPSQKVVIETEFLYPLAKGPGILAAAYDDPEMYVVFPYDKSDPYSPISRAELKKRGKHLLSYFMKYKKILEQQTHYSDAIRASGEFYGLARTGPYSFEDCYVAYRDNTKWRATVITDKMTPWGDRRRFLFQNHAVSICERDDGNIITKDEAYYVAGIFNAPVVAEFIYASSDNRSFKIRPPIRIPHFDKGDKTHRDIVSLSKAMHSDADEREKTAQAIERLYLSIC